MVEGHSGMSYELISHFFISVKTTLHHFSKFFCYFEITATKHLEDLSDGDIIEIRIVPVIGSDSETDSDYEDQFKYDREQPRDQAEQREQRVMGDWRREQHRRDWNDRREREQHRNSNYNRNGSLANQRTQSRSGLYNVLSQLETINIISKCEGKVTGALESSNGSNGISIQEVYRPRDYDVSAVFNMTPAQRRQLERQRQIDEMRIQERRHILIRVQIYEMESI